MSESKNKLINHAQIHWSDQSEPISDLFNDVYFNTEQGIEESFYVFFQGNDLSTCWLACESASFTIAETGFGSGLNFLVCCYYFQQFLTQHPERPLKRLHFSSFEKYPLNKQDLTTALLRWPTLKAYSEQLIAQYPLPLSGCHRLHFAADQISLDLWFGDVQQTLPMLYNPDSGLFDCWFLDGFAPSKNPEMWSDLLFQQIAASCKNKATIATFTAAGFVRRGLISAGFSMQKRKGYGKKREMLVGQIAVARSEIRQRTLKEVAILGGNIAGACLSLALIRRGYHVTLYCQESALAEQTASKQKTILYPLLNTAHDNLSQLFANSFLYARNYILKLVQSKRFAFDFSQGLYLNGDAGSGVDDRLGCLLQAQLPDDLVQQANNQQSLYYPLAGWVNQKQMLQAILDQAKSKGQLTIKCNHRLAAFSNDGQDWQLQFSGQRETHRLLVLTQSPNGLEWAGNASQKTDSSGHCNTHGHFPSIGAISDTVFNLQRHKDAQSSNHNLYMLGGFGAYALCLAPLAAEMLASQIDNEPLPFSQAIIDKCREK